MNVAQRLTSASLAADSVPERIELFVSRKYQTRRELAKFLSKA